MEDNFKNVLAFSEKLNFEIEKIKDIVTFIFFGVWQQTENALRNFATFSILEGLNQHPN